MKELEETPGVWSVSESTALTQQGKVLRNISRAENVDSRMERRVMAHIRSWQVARMLRRDFNLLATHIFFRMLKAAPEEKKAIEQLIGEILAQAAVLKFAVKNIPGVVIDETFEVETIPVRLFSRDISFLYRAITSLDDSFARLESAFRRGVVSEKDFREMARPGRQAWSDLRVLIFGKTWQVATESGMNALK